MRVVRAGERTPVYSPVTARAAHRSLARRTRGRTATAAWARAGRGTPGAVPAVRATSALELIGEQELREGVDVLVRLVEAAGATVVFVGAAIAFGRFLVALLRRHAPAAFVRIRLGLGRYLALGLELQLASDILSTAIAPTLEEIYQLAAVAAIRTALNYFLNRELDRERDEVEGARTAT